MRNDILVLPSRTSAAPKMKLVLPRFELNFKKCETRVNIGFFLTAPIITRIGIQKVFRLLTLQDYMVYIERMMRLGIIAYIFQGLARNFQRLASMQKAMLGRGGH